MAQRTASLNGTESLMIRGLDLAVKKPAVLDQNPVSRAFKTLNPSEVKRPAVLDPEQIATLKKLGGKRNPQMHAIASNCLSSPLTTEQKLKCLIRLLDASDDIKMQPCLDLGDVNAIWMDAANKSWTALTWACHKGNLGLVQFLINNYHADVNLRDNRRTPLYVASRDGHLSIVDYLVRVAKANVNLTNTEGATPLFVACQRGRVEVVKYLLQNKNTNVNKLTTNGAPHFYIACQNNHLEVVQCLIADGRADVNCSTDDGTTSLFIACQLGLLSMVKLLVEAGADINMPKLGGYTPLRTAVSNRHAPVVEYLLTIGAETDNVPTESNISAMLQRLQQPPSGPVGPAEPLYLATLLLASKYDVATGTAGDAWLPVSAALDKQWEWLESCLSLAVKQTHAKVQVMLEIAAHAAAELALAQEASNGTPIATVPDTPTGDVLEWLILFGRLPAELRCEIIGHITRSVLIHAMKPPEPTQRPDSSLSRLLFWRPKAPSPSQSPATAPACWLQAAEKGKPLLGLTRHFPAVIGTRVHNYLIDLQLQTPPAPEVLNHYHRQFQCRYVATPHESNRNPFLKWLGIGTKKS